MGNDLMMGIIIHGETLVIISRGNHHLSLYTRSPGFYLPIESYCSYLLLVGDTIPYRNHHIVF